MSRSVQEPPLHERIQVLCMQCQASARVTDLIAQNKGCLTDWCFAPIPGHRFTTQRPHFITAHGKVTGLVLYHCERLPRDQQEPKNQLPKWGYILPLNRFGHLHRDIYITVNRFRSHPQMYNNHHEAMEILVHSRAGQIFDRPVLAPYKIELIPEFKSDEYQAVRYSPPDSRYLTQYYPMNPVVSFEPKELFHNMWRSTPYGLTREQREDLEKFLMQRGQGGDSAGNQSVIEAHYWQAFL